MIAKPFFSSLLREPLLHFVLLGGLLFAVDHFNSARRDNPKVINIGAEVDNEAKSIFKSAQGREPTAAELKVLRERWIDTEVLYREGLALRVDQGDTAIRERVIFKALSVMQANLSLPPIDEKGLRAWFEQHRTQYDQPERIDFLEAVLAGNANGDSARQFAVALNSGSQGDAKSGLRVFKGRPRSNIVDSFGAEFANALERLKQGDWQTLPSKDGPRVVQLQGKTPGEAVTFESVQGRVRQDWQDAKMQVLRTAAVRELRKKYTLRTLGATS